MYFLDNRIAYETPLKMYLNVSLVTAYKILYTTFQGRKQFTFDNMCSMFDTQW
jgi:hypothetical protein